MSKERQLRKQQEIKNIILDVARNIITKEGIQGLSIRKITNEIDYSPAIIYHYFKGKEEIIEILISEGFEKIVKSIHIDHSDEQNPENEIRETFKSYITTALECSEEYKLFMLNDNSTVIKKTAILEKGMSNSSKTLQLLCSQIKTGVDKNIFSPCDLELTAQVIWSSIFGLIIKLIFEKNISEDQQNNLIERQLDLLFEGILKRK